MPTFYSASGLLENALRRRKSRIFSAFLFALLVVGSCFSSHAQVASIEGGDSYPTIQAAITAAADDATILVVAGAVSEEVNVNRRVTIKGAKAGIAAGIIPGARGTDETVLNGGFIVSTAGAVIDGFTIQNGRTSGSVKVGVAVSASDVQVLNNIIEDVVGAQSDGVSTTPSTHNLTLTNNTIRNNWRGIYLNPGSGNSLTGNLISANNGVGVGIASDGQSALTISGNQISDHTLEGLGASAVGAGVVVTDNILTNNGVSIAHYGGDQINASCNWWGSAELNDVTASLSGDVMPVPYRSDANLAGATCTEGPVHNVTQDKYYLQIQTAVNEAVDNDLIDVRAGVYTETISIGKSLEIRGPNFDKPGTDVTRVPEAVLENGTLVVTGSGTVKLAGFLILQTNDVANVFSLGGGANTTVENTIFERNGVNAGAGTRALVVSAGGGSRVIRNNLFTGDDSGNLFGGHKTWNSGIYVNGGGGGSLLIQDNTFDKTRSAINIDDLDSDIQLSGNEFKDNGTQLSFGGTIPTPGSHVLAANSFETPRSTTINLSNVATSFRLDITSSTLNGASFNSLSLPQLFMVEATMFHRGRSGRNGLVYYVANRQYVISPNPSVQAAIDYAPGTGTADVITIQDGSYNQRLTVSKPLTLLGESKENTILTGTGLAGTGSGILIASGVENVTIQQLTLEYFTGSSGNTHAGIYAEGQNHGLLVENVISRNNNSASGFYANGPVENVTITESEFSNNGPGARGIVIWNGHKKDITITNNVIKNNNCCGIELQDGSASGVLIAGNDVEALDSGISAVGLTSGSAKGNVIENNTVEITGRFGIEIKNPDGTGSNDEAQDGAIVVRGNTVSHAGSLTDLRDLAGIGVYRRGVLGGNADVPTGVYLTGNTVTGFVQPSTSTGFGIVIEGTNHTVTGNTLNGNDVGVQQQAGHSPYPADGNQDNVADDYFGRGNSPITCGNTVEANTFTSNTLDERNIGGGNEWIVNDRTGDKFCSIQTAIDEAAPQDVLKLGSGPYEQSFTVTKNLTLEGVNAGVCGTADGRSAETVLVTPGSGQLIGVADGVTATLSGFLIDGRSVAALTGTNQGLVFTHSVFELDFASSDNNLYVGPNNALTLNCNYFQAIGGTNSGGASSHIFFSGNSLQASANTFTSEAARASMSASTSSLPVWFNLTTSGTNVEIKENLFDKIDIGILLASNVGNVNILRNEFVGAQRQTFPFGDGLGAGIAVYQDVAPSAPVKVAFNKFSDSETGIRTSGSGTNFPASNLLEIQYNSFTGMSERAIVIGASYAGATNRLNALCNWFGAINGPVLASNAGASGMAIQDVANKVAYKNWLVYGDSDGAIGFQLPSTVSVAAGSNTSVAENNYRLLSNAIGCAQEGQTVALSGTFNYSGVALDEWAKGNDGESATAGDNYAVIGPLDTDNVILTGPAVIEGPGDLAAVNQEAFLRFNNSLNRDWEISNLTIKGFDVALNFTLNGGSASRHDNLKVINNEFHIPKDLTADAGQNIGVHLSLGKNQLVADNKVFIDGTGESSGTTYSFSFFLQSNTSGGDGYDGLKITRNEIVVDGMPAADPAVIRGIWENGQNTNSSIEISENTFSNSTPGNLASLNRQHAMWVTSRSAAAGDKKVVYQNNEVTGFAEGIGWLGGDYTSNSPINYQLNSHPVLITNNKFDQVKRGVVVRKLVSSPNTESPAFVTTNSFTNLVDDGFAIINESAGTTDASCNWYDVALVSNVISGDVDFGRKLANGDDASSDTGFQNNSDCLYPVYNETQNTDYLTIQQAVDAADPTNVIRVSTGIYPENVTVDKAVTIYGVSRENVIVDKANYASDAGAGFAITGSGVTLKTMTVQNFNFGVSTHVSTPVGGLTLEEVNLVDNFGAGFYSNGSIDGLTITGSNLTGNGNKGGVVSASPYKRGIMLQSSAADYSNVVITGNVVNQNGLSGIDVNLNKSLNGLTITGNEVKGNVDAQISAWLGNSTLADGPILIHDNTLELSGASRFGIEIKNPLATGSGSGAGSLVVSDNTVAVASGHAGAAGDMAAIAVIRRKDGAANDQPQGAVISGNAIQNFQNIGAGDAFGIVVGGIGHSVLANTITSTEYAIQLQKGNTNYDNENVSPSPAVPNNAYFDRDNSNDACAEIAGNVISGSGDPRIVTGPSETSDILPVARVTNLALGTKFCTIQQGINFTATTNGHTLEAEAGDYAENVEVTKSLTILGPNAGTIGSGSRSAEANVVPAVLDLTNGRVFDVKASAVAIKGFTISGANSDLGASGVAINGVNTQAAHGVYAVGDLDNIVVENNIISHLGKNGVYFDAQNGSTHGNEIAGNFFDNLPRHSTADGGSYGRGVLLANNFYASVVNNIFERVERGLQTNNFSKAIESGVWEIRDNAIKAYNIGAFINLHYQATSDLGFKGNVIEKETADRIVVSEPLPDAVFTGIEVFSIADAVKVTIKEGTIRNAEEGIYSWNNPTSEHVTIDGVAFENNGIAVLQSNYSRYPNAADTEIDVRNVSIAAGDAERAFVAEHHAGGSGNLSAIRLLENNSVAAAYPFHLKGGAKARITVANTSATLSTHDAFTFDTPGASTEPNVVIGENFTVNLNGNDLRVLELPAGTILELAGNFTAPTKVVKNPLLLHGAVWFTHGVLNSGDGEVEFGGNASDITTGDHKEHAGSYLIGKALMLARSVNTAAIDMLGVKMGSGANIGNLTITRTTSLTGSISPAFQGDESIRTVWDINSSLSSANRGNVQFRYLNIEAIANEQDPDAIFAYRYNTGNAQWEKKSAQLEATADGTGDVLITSTFGMVEFSSWTLSAAEPGPDLTLPSVAFYPLSNITNLSQTRNLIVNLSEVNGIATNPSNPIEVRISRPAGFNITFNQGASALSGIDVDNPQWERYNESSTNFVFVRYVGGSIGANGESSFGLSFQAATTAASNGQKPITVTILSTPNDNNAENNSKSVVLQLNLP